MPYIGNELATQFQAFVTQTITGDGSTGYTLDRAVANGKELLVYINNVKQEEGSGKSYTASGTTITFSAAVASTDSCYVVFLGSAVQTVVPPDASIVSGMIANANLEMPNTLDMNGKELILDADGDTSITADTDDQIDFKTGGSDKVRITTTGNVGINSTSPSTYIDDSDGQTLVLEAAGTERGAIVFASEVTGGEGEIIGLINFTDTASGNTNKRGAAIKGHRGSSDTNPFLTFHTANAEAMRIHSNQRVSIGSTTFDSQNAGVFLSESKGFFTRASDAPVAINRLTNDGNLVELQQDSNTEGSISVSGSTVSYNGFSGLHESSGIATDTPIGTVVSTIDELDVYSAKQNGMEGELVDSPKAGQPRADHAKVEVSDTVGDSAVYGVVGSFNSQGKVNVISVGIGSVRVTGACAKGDLLESNGDGTAKVQSDDIVRSKTLGKVTIGNSDTGVKLVSCVLYCG